TVTVTGLSLTGTAAANYTLTTLTATTTAAITAAPTGLVAAYGFNEGTGSTVTDASGSGNVGTINGATWTTQGKFGSALTFNGIDNLVVIPGSASLNVSTAMTLSGWIYPTAAQSGWRTILQREVNAYYLNASVGSGTLLPGGGATLNGSTQDLSGPTASPV